MPRSRRLDIKNAFYHIMLRGNYRQNIFNDETDKLNFLQKLSNAIKKYQCNIHLFCLMTNHVHMVIEVNNVPISSIMHSISSSYAKQFNNRIKRNGHLFQGRYKSLLISNDKYLLELCYYIHMNPINAGMCKSLDDYPWSSHHAYLNKTVFDFVYTKHISRLLKRHVIADKNHYREFINNRDEKYSEPSFCDLNEGGELIITDCTKKISQQKSIVSLESLSIQKIAETVCKHLDVQIKELDSPSQARKTTLARSLIAYFAHYYAKHTLSDVAASFCLKTGSVSKTMHRHLQGYEGINDIINILEMKLSVSSTDNSEP